MSTTTPIDGSGKGYIRLHRKLLEHPLFKDKPVAWLKIWLYILMRANWRESEFHPRQGESIVVPAGSLIHRLKNWEHTPDFRKNTRGAAWSTWSEHTA
jgi:hypothetical protein